MDIDQKAVLELAEAILKNRQHFTRAEFDNAELSLMRIINERFQAYDSSLEEMKHLIDKAVRLELPEQFINQLRKEYVAEGSY